MYAGFSPDMVYVPQRPPTFGTSETNNSNSGTRELTQTDLRQKRAELASLTAKIAEINWKLDGSATTTPTVAHTIRLLIRRNDKEEVLRAAHVDPNLLGFVDDDGKTVLHYAAEYGCYEALRALIDLGMDPKLTDNAGRTARALASEYHHSAIVQLLDGVEEDGVEDDEQPMTPRRARHLESEWSQDYVVSSHNVEAPPQSNSPRTSDAPAKKITAKWPKESNNYVIIMVGLPGKGKSFVCQRLVRYLCWKGTTAKIFNVAQIRREIHGITTDNFVASNKELASFRDSVAFETAQRITKYLGEHPGAVAFLDATNTTRDRREKLFEIFAENLEPHRIVFLECILEDPEMVRFHRMRNVNVDNYKPSSLEALMVELDLREAEYRHIYQTMQPEFEPKLSFIQTRDSGCNHTYLHKISGQIPLKMVKFLTNLWPIEESVYMTCIGETANDVAGRLGGDTVLTRVGERFAIALVWYFEKEKVEAANIFTSTRRSAVATARWLANEDTKYKRVGMGPLDDLNYGDFENKTLEQVRSEIPNTLAKLIADPYDVAWLRGESYHDVMVRLEHAIMEMNASKVKVIAIGHVPTIQGLYAYRTDLPPEAAPKITLKKHTVYKFIPRKAMRGVSSNTNEASSGTVVIDVSLESVMEKITEEMLDDVLHGTKTVAEVLTALNHEVST